VAERVVDALELIEIHVEQGQELVLGLGLFDGLLEPFAEAMTVGEARETVVVGEVADLGLHLALVGHVLERAVYPGAAITLLERPLRPQLDVPHLVRGQRDAVLRVDLIDEARLFEVSLHRIAVAGVYQPEQALKRRVDLTRLHAEDAVELVRPAHLIGVDVPFPASESGDPLYAFERLLAEAEVGIAAVGLEEEASAMSDQPPGHGLDHEVVGAGPCREIEHVGSIGCDGDEHRNPFVLAAPGIGEGGEVLGFERCVLDEQEARPMVGEGAVRLADVGGLRDREALDCKGLPRARAEVLTGGDHQDERRFGLGGILSHSKGFVGLWGEGL
jgi:hypothetical protein